VAEAQDVPAVLIDEQLGHAVAGGVAGRRVEESDARRAGSALCAIPSLGDSAVVGASVIVAEYLKHATLSPEALVKLARELRGAPSPRPSPGRIDAAL
jgi:hypothetical protein